MNCGVKFFSLTQVAVLQISNLQHQRSQNQIERLSHLGPSLSIVGDAYLTQVRSNQLYHVFVWCARFTAKQIKYASDLSFSFVVA